MGGRKSDCCLGSVGLGVMRGMRKTSRRMAGSCTWLGWRICGPSDDDDDAMDGVPVEVV